MEGRPDGRPSLCLMFSSDAIAFFLNILSPEELVDEVASPHAAQFVHDGASHFGLVPEEELALGELVALRLGREDGLQGVGVHAGVPCLGAHGHGRGGEVLHLL